MPGKDSHEDLDELAHPSAIKLGLGIVPLTLVPSRRELNHPMLVNGNLVFAYDSVEISEYLDTATGEIISAAQMAFHPDLKPTMRAGELTLQKQAVLSQLRPEVREFAYFVLAFRDQRRGVTPTIDVLVKWYAKMTGRRGSDIKRYLPRLDEAGICNGSVMYPLFQFAGTKAKKISHLGADIAASGKFTIMCHRYRLRMADEAKRAEIADRNLQSSLQDRCTQADGPSQSIRPTGGTSTGAETSPYGKSPNGIHSGRRIAGSRWRATKLPLVAWRQKVTTWQQCHPDC